MVIMLDHRIQLGLRSSGRVKRKLGCSIISRIFLLFIVYTYALDVLLDSIVSQLSHHHSANLLSSNHHRSLGNHRSSVGEPSTYVKTENILGGGSQDSARCETLNYGDDIAHNITADFCIRAARHSRSDPWKTGLIDWFDAPEVNRLHLVRGIVEFKRWLGFGCGFRKNNGALWMLQTAEAIRLVRLEAPNYIEAGRPVKLRCIYETRGDKLQSLSWYKNGHEFYRYQPFERRQPVLAFNYTGITVDLTKSRNSTVFLTNTTNETSGRYKCEATATNFQEVNMETYVTIITPSSSGAAVISNCHSQYMKYVITSLLAAIVISSLLLNH